MSEENLAELYGKTCEIAYDELVDFAKKITEHHEVASLSDIIVFWEQYNHYEEHCLEKFDQIIKAQQLEEEGNYTI